MALKTLTFSSPETQQHQIILRWRWLVLIAGPATTIVMELWEEHGLMDVHVLLEVLIFGFFIPSITWLVLTLLARNLAQRVRSEEHLVRHRRFTQQLNECREWEELTKFITEFPGTLLPVEHTALFLYDHHNARLEFAASWRNFEGAVAPINASLAYDFCQACLLKESPGLRSTANCSFTLDKVDGRRGDEFCLPFSYNNMLVGVLRVKCQPGQSLSQDQVQFVNAVAPEIALALALAISYPRELAQVRTEAQLDERNYIAYVLHNSLAQQIGYLHLSLDRLASDGRLQPGDAVRNELEQLRAVAGDAYERIRNTLALLRSHQQSDLTQAIVEHARAVSRTTHLQFEFTTQGEPRLLDPPTCQNIVGLLQEGLNNVFKHAHAQHVHITLAWSPDRLTVNVVDDGVGFDPVAAPGKGHYGITMMRERVKALGGDFTLLSAPGEGAQLLFTFLLPRLQVKPSGEDTLANPAASA